MKSIENKEIGVGQLLRFLGVQPNFQLVAAGKLYEREERADEKDNEAYCLWRDYELFAKQFRCRFVERFAPKFEDMLSDIGDSKEMVM